MSELRKRMVEKIEALPDEMLKLILDFIEYMRTKEEMIGAFESKYGSFNKLKEKIMNDEHTWEEERDFFEWEAAITEMKKLKRLLGFKSENL